MVGKELRRLRDERSLSPTELARLSQVSRARIYAIEDDAGGHPTLDTLHKLARGLSAWRDGVPDAAEFPEVFRSLVTAAGYPVEQASVPNGEGVTSEVPSPLAGPLLEILENWPRWSQLERETAARLLDVASNLGRPDGPPGADTVGHRDSGNFQNATTGVLSIISRLMDIGHGAPARIPSRIAPTPTRELAYAGV